MQEKQVWSVSRYHVWINECYLFLENFKIVALPFCFHFVGLEEKVSRAKRKIRFLVSWYTLPRARNFKPLFEFQTPQAQNYPAGTSELIALAPTRIYIEIVHNVEIVLLAWNYPADTSELFPLGANSDLHRNFTLHRIFPAGMKFRIYVEIVHYVEIVSLARNSPAGASEWFPFCANSDLHRNCTLHINCPSGTSEFISF